MVNMQQAQQTQLRMVFGYTPLRVHLCGSPRISGKLCRVAVSVVGSGRDVARVT